MAQYKNNKRTYKRRSPKTYVSKRVIAAPKSKTNLVRLIKNIQLRQSETKYKSRDLTHGAMNHNTINAITVYDKDAALGPISIFPTNGTYDYNRIGDRIIAQKIKLRIQFDVPWDRKNVKVKMYFLEYNSDQGDPENYGTFFHTITGNSRLDPVQFKRWGKSLRYLGEYKPMDNDASTYFTYPHSTDAPPANHIATNTASICIKKDLYFKRKITFTSDGEMTASNLKEKGVLLFLPYATANTAYSDNLLTAMDGAATLYYKDM